MTLKPTSSRGAGELGELFYTEFTSNVTVNVYSEATAVTIVSSGSQTFSDTIIIEFFCPVIEPTADSNGTGLFFLLQDGSTVLGQLAFVSTPTSATSGDVPVHLVRRLTPAAGSHTYKITAYSPVSGKNWTVFGGSGGSGAYVPGFIRISSV